MTSKRQHSLIKSGPSSIEDVEAHLQEEIKKLSKKRQSGCIQQSGSAYSVVYNPITGKRLQQPEHYRPRRKRRNEVASKSKKVACIL